VSPRNPEDTIVAVSTPPGEGGIGIVRVSGPEAIRMTHAIFVSTTGRDIRTSPGRVFHGEVRAAAGILDEVLVHVMRAPHSYTREDVVEINGHGGAAPLQAILESVLAQGARLARPGEFTLRAFLNGRIDLVQAEAVIDRIRAQSQAALRAASTAASGRLSREIRALNETLVGALAHVEASIDFPDEDLPELVNETLRMRLEGAHEHMIELLRTAESGRRYREGARIAIVGRPNAGKSSLFNAMLREARAIVTAQPGTTRDLLEETCVVGGVPVRLADTAGLRHARDEAEQAGVRAARAAMGQAEAVLLVVDGSESDGPENAVLAEDALALDAPSIAVVNKIDLPHARAFQADWLGRFKTVCAVSSVTGEGIVALEEAIAQLLLGANAVTPEQALITRAHQRDSLRRAADALDRLLAHYDASPEFLSLDLREAIAALGEITGETTSEEILDRIFTQFCIGK